MNDESYHGHIDKIGTLWACSEPSLRFEVTMTLRVVMLEVQDQQRGALKALAQRDTRTLRR